jgi:anti-sigma28 factor (negative regulator of flagellin synthesis)
LEIDRTSAARPPHIPANPDTTPASPPPARDDVPERRDRIELSGTARDAAQLPDDARAARIAALRAQVEAGTYDADPSAIARSLLARQDL